MAFPWLRSWSKARKNAARQTYQRKPIRRPSRQPRLLLAALEERACPTAVAILGAPSNPAWLSDVQSKVQGTNFFTSVAAINVNTSTPTLADLQNYDSVLVFSDAPFQNAAALGNNLFSYVNGGGGVVSARCRCQRPPEELGFRRIQRHQSIQLVARRSRSEPSSYQVTKSWPA